MTNALPLNPRLHLSPEHLGMVQAIFADHLPQARVLVCGSLAAGIPRKYSDLDLATIQPEPLTLRTFSRLKITFEDSDLSICVDVVDWNQADSAFKATVTKQGISCY
mgnify:CR=1 FL=1